MTYKKPRRTPAQRALAKAIRPIAKDTANQMKAVAPKLTGALRFSIGYKIQSKSGWAKAIIGVKSRYTRTIKGVTKLPNLYAWKEEKREHFLHNTLQGKQRLLINAAAKALQEILPDKSK